MREDILAVILFAGDAGGGNAVEFLVTLALLFAELLHLLIGDRLAHRDELQIAVHREASAARDEVTEDDVLLEAAEFVHAAHRRGLGEDAGRVLEGRGRDEGVGFERGLRDAEERGLRFRRTTAFVHHLLVDLQEGLTRDLLAPEEVRIARIGDADLAEHLADDDLDVLVVDFHALQTVNLLGTEKVSCHFSSATRLHSRRTRTSRLRKHRFSICLNRMSDIYSVASCAYQWLSSCPVGPIVLSRPVSNTKFA